MRELSTQDFREYLLSRHAVTLNSRNTDSNLNNIRSESSLKRLGELSGLAHAEFADDVARFWGLARCRLPDLLACAGQADRFSRRFLRESGVFPFQAANGAYQLAVADPTDTAAIRAAEIVFGQPVEVVVASSEDIFTVLEQRTEAENMAAVESQSHERGSAEDDLESLRDLASGAPVVRAVNDLLERALELRASDIHVEPFRTGLVIRMRVDGLLRSMPAPSDVLPQALVSRVKILAGLNIAERRLPQDGAARLRVKRSEIDFRVATMPTQHGESVVMRLLPRDSGLLELGKLGLSNQDRKIIDRLLALPHGMIVVTGPTGSGKTTMLATMLSMLNVTTRKILTIEDPVEYELPGLNQSQVKPEIGLTFANALRAFVRQDPDVIMVGEVRDAETANTAIHAALTGHLVLTTLHTETAAAAIPRLLDLGVEGFLLKSTLRAVIAQRLVRVLCDRCKTEHVLTSADLQEDPRFAMLGFAEGERTFEAVGCERCGGTGYRGRCGVFEVLEMTQETRKLIDAQTDSDTIDREAIGSGMTTMLDDAVAKCRLGVTTVSEALRVTTVR